MQSETIHFYATNPQHMGALEEASIQYKEHNRLCGDDIEVFLVIESLPLTPSEGGGVGVNSPLVCCEQTEWDEKCLEGHFGEGCREGEKISNFKFQSSKQGQNPKVKKVWVVGTPPQFDVGEQRGLGGVENDQKLEEKNQGANFIIKEWSFIGNTSMITRACAGLFGDIVQGKTFAEIFAMNQASIISDTGITVSPRRERAQVLPLLATRNAIHEYLNDGIKDDFSDVMGE